MTLFVGSASTQYRFEIAFFNKYSVNRLFIAEIIAFDRRRYLIYNSDIIKEASLNKNVQFNILPIKFVVKLKFNFHLKSPQLPIITT